MFRKYDNIRPTFFCVGFSSLRINYSYVFIISIRLRYMRCFVILHKEFRLVVLRDFSTKLITFYRPRQRMPKKLVNMY